MPFARRIAAQRLRPAARAGLALAVALIASALGARRVRAQEAPEGTAAPAPTASAFPSAPLGVPPPRPSAPVGEIVPLPARTPPEEDARDGVSLPPGSRSVRIERDGEVLYRRPDRDSPRRGTAARGALLPALEAVLGNGCGDRWVRVERDAWVCLDEAELSHLAPQTTPAVSVPEGMVTPYQYAFARYAGVPTYRRPGDAEYDERAEELERGMGVAIDRTELHRGRRFVHTPRGRWLAIDDVHWTRVSDRAGVRFAPGEALDAWGFVQPRGARAFASLEGAQRGRGPSTTLAYRTPLHVLERSGAGSQTFVRSEQGWIDASRVRFAQVPAPPANLAPDERWVDVDTARQLTVAFEGTRPVYLALVSTGRSGHPTVRGEYRVWVKLFATDMSNADDPSVSDTAALYSVERVPWVMFFHNDQALHGTYWHDGFGAPRSHGCVNLPARDARWFFEWAPPRVPPGWEAALPTPAEPGLRVRVR